MPAGVGAAVLGIDLREHLGCLPFAFLARDVGIFRRNRRETKDAAASRRLQSAHLQAGVARAAIIDRSRVGLPVSAEWGRWSVDYEDRFPFCVMACNDS